MGDGPIVDVPNQSPGETLNVIRDAGLEWSPIIVGVIGAVFLVGLTFYLIRRGLARFRQEMRL